MSGQVSGLRITPELVPEEKIRARCYYKRFQRQESKTEFRHALLSQLMCCWRGSFGGDTASRIVRQFEKLSRQLDQSGAVVVGSLIPAKQFSLMVSSYERLMSTVGSRSLLHTYINLHDYPEFLTDPSFNEAFFHPLLVALMSYQVGSPVRVVDARGKDAQPISVRAQDNMLHIDNTPFNDEYKILITWQRGKASGPKGQNFVFLPGTHRGARNCFVEPRIGAWSTENASVFTSPETVDKLLEFQKEITGRDPQVVEIHDPDNPLSTLFAAGSLVHHRYRTETGCDRSSLILAFHSIVDNPGAFIEGRLDAPSETVRCLLAYNDRHSVDTWIEDLSANALKIGEKLYEIASGKSETTIIEHFRKTLVGEQLHSWRQAVTSAPEIEDVKDKRQANVFGRQLSLGEVIDVVGKQMMAYDKHGPLDLILYHDSHEEIRKWARNRIREMRLDTLLCRLREWKQELRQPILGDLMSVPELHDAAVTLDAHLAVTMDDSSRPNFVNERETITLNAAHKSYRQLAVDLGEAIGRSYSPQNFLSTSLFLFWAYDGVVELSSLNSSGLKPLAGKLLRHYIVTAILVHETRHSGD